MKRSARRILGCALLCAAWGCGAAPHAASVNPVQHAHESVRDAEKRAARKPRVVTVIGTSDLHGHLAALPVLAGYLNNLRRAAAARGDAVVLLDAGDMFQGTLESNGVEGESVVQAYNLLGYDAVAVGNHEFDFGPEGPAISVPRAAWADAPRSDPRGALRQRARQSALPFLLANVAQDTLQIPLEPIRASVQKTLRFGDGSSVQLGIVGGSSAETARVTLAANVSDLQFLPPEEIIAKKANELRKAGAQLVLATVHAGSRCERFTGDAEADGCDRDGEAFRIARAAQTLDALVAGHTHAGVAHVEGKVPIVQSFAHGVAFGRVDLKLNERGEVSARHVHPPQFLCKNNRRAVGGDCELGEYEGAQVQRDAQLQQLVEKYMQLAHAQRTQKLGVTVLAPIERSYDAESALGNLFADAARNAAQADVGLYNGGGLRASLPAGELEYGALHAALPFDNLLVVTNLSVLQLRQWIARNLQSSHGVLSLSGIVAKARCVDGALQLQLFRSDARGRALHDAQKLRVAGSDYLLGGGDDVAQMPAFELKQRELLLRDAVAQELARHGQLRPEQLLDPARPRLDLPSARPVRCAAR